MFRGRQNVIEEYKVGPLPAITSATKITNTFSGGQRTIPYELRNLVTPPDYAGLNAFIAREMAQVDDFIRQVGF